MAELEAQLASVTAERDRNATDLAVARGETARIRESVSSATGAAANARQEVRVAAEVIDRLNARLHAAWSRNALMRHELEEVMIVYGVPGWMWLLILAMAVIGIFLLLFAWPIRPWTRRPLLDLISHLRETIEELEGDKRSLAARLVEELAALKKELAVFADGEKKRRTRTAEFVRHAFRRLRARLEGQNVLVGRALPAIEALVDFQIRKERIAENHVTLMKLREQEEEFDNFLRLIDVTEESLAAAKAAEDEDLVKNCRVAIDQYRAQIDALPFDPSSLKAEIAGLVATLKRDMELQCGLHFDTRASDEWKAEWEDRKREEVRHAEVAKQTFIALIDLVERRGVESIAEITAKKLELENEFAAKEGERAKLILAYDGRIQELVQKLEDADIDPGNGESVSALWSEAPLDPAEPPPRPRVPTLVITALRESQIPAPPSSPMNALNRDVYRFLDTIRSLPQDTWTLDCDDAAGQDWAYFLHGCSISTPSIGVVPLRKYLSTVTRLAPNWLTERLRRPTDLPPAP